MSENETVIRAVDLSKVYRLYSKPIYKFLDVFGLLGKDGHYTEHHALKRVNIEIRRGEKVAFIGRNGAGKSTLLKIITGGIRPSSGDIWVNGRVSALLQIGTGFHPDFTGRQNVYSALAHQGITGVDAHRLFEEAVEFSELSEYIDQPVKTYSTGMAARLMFSANTILAPDILVIDELLGVGDAYFAHKSYDRMRRMCSDLGTTLLLVTHDLYTALNLCDRFVWIDKGGICLEGDGKTVVTAYEHSVKAQEEERRSLQRLRQASIVPSKGQGSVRLRIGSPTGFALPEPMALAAVELIGKDGRTTRWNMAESLPDGWALLQDANLSPPSKLDGRLCRILQPYGSIFHSVELRISGLGIDDVRAVVVTSRYEGLEPAHVVIRADDGTQRLLGAIEQTPTWSERRWNFADSQNVGPAGGAYGNGRIAIDRLALLGPEGSESALAHCGDNLSVQVDISLRDPTVAPECTFVVALHREGVAYALRLVHDRLSLAGADRHRVTVSLDPPVLGAARFFVTVSLFEPDYFSVKQDAFFTVNPRCFCTMTRALEFVVEATHGADGVSIAKLPHRLHIQALS